MALSSPARMHRASLVGAAAAGGCVLSSSSMAPGSPTPLHQHAEEHLAFIRDTMARAGSFTAVPGWGGVWIGSTALAVAALAGPERDADRWLVWWIGEAVLAVAIGLAGMTRKANRLGLSVSGAVARRFAWAFVPALLAGAVLTLVCVARGLEDLLPGVWLLLYGTAVAGGGAQAVKVVPAMGLMLMALGAAAFLTPPGWANAWMAVGFGAGHIGFGIIIARKHGG